MENIENTINENDLQEEDKPIKCKATLNRKMFYDDEGNYGIISMDLVENIEGKVELSAMWNNFTVKGIMPKPEKGIEYTIVANEIIDEKWGKQYDCIFMGTPMNLKDDTERQKIFLENVLTKKQVDTMYNTLEDPFQAIQDENIEKIVTVKGIGTKTALKIIEKYKQTIDFSEVYVELHSYGLTPKMIEKLVSKYNSPQLVVQKVKENPYILVEEVEGIGWTKADKIALDGGMSTQSPHRIKAFIKYYLDKEAQNGNTWVVPNILMRNILENIGNVDRFELKNILHSLHETRVLWWNETKTKIGLARYVNLEYKVAYNITRLLNANNNFNYDLWLDVVKQTEDNQGWCFTDQQLEGIRTVLENQVVIVTGRAGTGKSSVVSGMRSVLIDYECAQCALSGKAAARLAEVTGEEGHTIHRLLKYNPREGGFLYDDKNKLPCEIVILDELSMVGGDLFYKLIRAIETGSKLIMLGDTAQLEAIGVMNVLKDLIESGIVPVVELTKIHRQAQKSAIITDSLRISESNQITPKNFQGIEVRGDLKDLITDIYTQKETSKSKIIHYFEKYLPEANTIMDIQIIVPMRSKGECCTFNINKDIQEIYNPINNTKKEVKIKLSKTLSYTLREGDKILNIRNNYKTVSVNGELKPIYNGTTGLIKEIDEVNNFIIADFQHVGEIIVPSSHWKYLDLGYAMTVHKMQGSQCDICIVGGIDYSAYAMLNRELVYTALTRVKKKGVLCAENNALHHAIRTSKVFNKQTLLKEYLRELSQPEEPIGLENLKKEEV